VTVQRTGRGAGAGGGRPRHSFVIPAHNAQRTVASSVRSALGQRGAAELEVIVVDDGSTDDTARVVGGIEDPRVRLHRQPNRGLPAARNQGVRLARGELVCFLDSDDLVLPGYLASVQRALDQAPDAAFVYTDAWTFDDRTRRVRRQTTAHYQHPPRPAPSTARGLFRELCQRNFIIVPVAVRRDVILSVGLFDETLTSAEDWDMWLRLTVAGHRGVEAPGPLALRREHERQMTSDYPRMAANGIRTLEKLLAGGDLSAHEVELVSASLRAARREYGAVSGEDRPRHLARRARWRLGAVRRRLGLGARWYDEPPAPVRAAFGDLSGV